jgi:Ca-activated chloride channel family protein
MIQGFPYVVRIAILAQFCALGFAFQESAAGPLQTIPRAHPQAAITETAAQPVVRVNSSLVTIPVHVITASGASVTTLKKEDFVLFEDGVKQTITHFVQDDAPISVGVLLDISSSMKNKMEKASQAASEFFKSANTGDEFFLVEFNARARLKIPFTHDWSAISDEISHAKPSGMTAMLDGIQLGIAQMKHARNNRKALLILSDGGDNFSRRSVRQLKGTLLEADVQVYAMGVFDFNYSMKHTPEERNGPKLLDQMANETGGRDFPLLSLENLPNIGVQIARELRNQYVLGFSPAASIADGKYHRVNLQLAPQKAEGDLRAYYRQGYYAPEQ